MNGYQYKPYGHLYFPGKYSKKNPSIKTPAKSVKIVIKICVFEILTEFLQSLAKSIPI